MPFHLPGRLRPVAAAVAVAAAAAAWAAGCAAASAASPVAAGPEKTHITVAAVPATDEVPFEIAIKRGFFRQQGLSLTVKTVVTSTLAFPLLAKGQVDVIAGANYVNVVDAQVSRMLDFTVIAPAASCTASDLSVVTLKGSKIQKPADLVGKTIGVPVTGSAITLSIDEQLRASGVSPSSVHYVIVPFPDMLSALEGHQVDAVSLIEPFLTHALVTAGVQEVLPQCTGPTQNMPLTGDVTTARFAEKYPRTAAAYARAIAEGAQAASASRPAEEQALAALVPKTSRRELAVMNFNLYPLTLNRTALQQVPDLMFQDHLLKSPLNIAPLLLLGGAR